MCHKGAGFRSRDLRLGVGALEPEFWIGPGFQGKQLRPPACHGILMQETVISCAAEHNQGSGLKLPRTW